MANREAAFLSVIAGSVIVYSVVTGRKVIDVLLLRGSTLPQTQPSGSKTPNQSSAVYGGLRDAVVQAAQQAANEPQGTYDYSQTRPYPPNLFGPPNPVKTDCSGFVTLCYKEAGAPDPNGLGYSGQGYTGTLLVKGKSVNSSKVQPGDLAFWSGPDHVAVYIGGGKIIEFGAPPAPIENSVSSENGFHSSFLGYRSYLG